MRNGTRAAVSLLQLDKTVESIPYNYGTIVATRQLNEDQVLSFLDAARISCGADHLIARSVPLRPAPSVCHVGSRIAGWTSVVYLEKGGVLEPRFAQKARHSIRKAARAGAELNATADPEGFLPLYAASSTGHWMRYPEELIRRLARADVARFFDVRLESACIASVMVLTSSHHWMAWLAAQNEQGRAIDANYFAWGEMLSAAQRARVAGVNLGISLGMPGVAHFKRRFDAIEVPVVEYRVMPWAERARLRAKVLKLRGLRRARRLVRRM
ncbi:MAG TPA: GNAT family N-acetyltransferase [Gemmatimonadota bacterium]|nr:GNAT family N-acetyltransferase [Gemmatimonadota bacterium]